MLVGYRKLIIGVMALAGTTYVAHEGLMTGSEYMQAVTAILALFAVANTKEVQR